MDAKAVVGAILALFTYFTGVPSLDDRKRNLKSKLEYLRAQIDDIENSERAPFSARVQRGRKRKRESDLCTWVDEGRELLKAAETLYTQVEGYRNLLTSTKKRKVVDKVVDALAIHEKKGDILYMHAFPDKQCPNRGNYIPVKKIIGKTALNTLEKLQHLLEDAKIGRVAIHGREGIGKTFFMKHLNNFALKCVERFDYVFWVSSPEQFSIRHVQDAVAAVVNCYLPSDDDLNVRASKLSNTLADLGNFLLFLDGVPEADFSLDQIGIPVPVEGSECKLILTTSSTLGCRILDGFGTIELNFLPEKEALELFIHEAGIDMRRVTLLDNIPRSLAKRCCGVPRMIVNSASRMWDTDDIREWRHEFESGNFEK